MKTVIGDSWINRKWRPMMGWCYMITCVADFIVFPIFWSILQAAHHGQVTLQWQPVTLQGAGLFHIAMGAVLGITAYGRTQEKINGVHVVDLPDNLGTTYQPPNQNDNRMDFGKPVSTTVYQTYENKNSNRQNSFTTARSGKIGPVQPESPEL